MVGRSGLLSRMRSGSAPKGKALLRTFPAVKSHGIMPADNMEQELSTGDDW